MNNKYVLYIDYMSGFIKDCDYSSLTAKTPFEAIAEAEQIYRELRKFDRVYLIRIMEKTGKVEALRGSNWKRQKYVAKMCKRSEKCGWHENDELHGENHHEVYKYKNSDHRFFYTMED